MQLKIDNHLVLELVADKHAEALYQVAEANRQHLSKWLPWLEHMQSVDFIKNFIAGSRKQYTEKSGFAYVIIKDNNLIGRIGVYNIDYRNKTGAIGYWIAKEHEGKGIITRGCRELIAYSFTELQLNRIEIRCAVDNIRSRQIPEKLGFVNEGIVRQGELVNNVFIDLYNYSLLKSDWEQQQNKAK